MANIEELKKMCGQVRRDIVRMVHAVNSGHPGGSLGCVEYLVALYGAVMKHDPSNFSMDGKNEDLFFLSNGHISPVFYSVLARSGYFPPEELKTFRKLNSRLQGHPTTHEGLPGVRIASGSLGQGMSVAIGAALAKKYPESFDAALPQDVVYTGSLGLQDKIEVKYSNTEGKNITEKVDAGKLVLSPTRTYAPIIKKVISELGYSNIDGIVHCSGGAQTKVLHFMNEGLHVIKDNLFELPPLFKTIHEQSHTDYKEMYKVFNMGHRMELYLDEKQAETVISISKSFNVDARIVGRVEAGSGKKVSVRSEFGEFVY